MALSHPEAARYADLRNDRRRLRAKADRYRRLSEEWRVLQVEAELALAAIETELRALEKLRAPEAGRPGTAPLRAPFGARPIQPL